MFNVLLQWVANSVSDMYADAVLAVILQVESNPALAQGDTKCYQIMYCSLFCRVEYGNYDQIFAVMFAV